MTKITEAGFIATIDGVIYGSGMTEAEAMKELLATMRVATFAASASLMEDVSVYGGDIGWQVVNKLAIRDQEGKHALAEMIGAGADKASLEAAVCTHRKVTAAEIDEDGDVFIEGVQGNRWLSDNEIAEFVLWLQNQ